MRRNVWGWVALSIVAVVCVATSPVKTTRPAIRHLEADFSERVVVQPGPTVALRVTVTLAAAANPAVEGLVRTGTLVVASSATALSEAPCDGTADGGRCGVDTDISRPRVAFAGGATELPLFEGCATGVDCEQSVLVEVRMPDGDPRTMSVDLTVRAVVENAGFEGQGLSILAQ